MRLSRPAVALLVLALLAACAGSPPPTSTPAPLPTPTPGGPPPRVALTRLASGLQNPLDIRLAPDGSQRLFVVERRGLVQIVKDGQVQAAPFLDLTNLVGTNGSERGLLGLAFHPRFATNGFVYVNYTDRQGDTVIARYTVSPAGAETAAATSAKTILTYKQPFPNHNGGNLVFGPDGYLWIGSGDGGSAGDPRGNGQNGETLLGKMLRIDVDGGDPYAVPADNPHVNRPGFRPEIWAVGLRNPWRYGFDRVTGDLYIADVGQNSREEVNYVAAGSAGGLNFGWNTMEGMRCFKPADNCQRDGLVLPIFDYGHDKGCSVTGGSVYRGAALPGLVGAYVFGDFCTGRIWALRQTAGVWRALELHQAAIQISSFGEDADGEILVASYGSGEVLRLVPAA